MRLPEDIHPQWLNVIRRLQSIAKSRNVKGCAIVSINVLMLENGKPLIWAEPKCTLIEPMKDNTKIIDLLTEVL